jgi:hypothetical protein
MSNDPTPHAVWPEMTPTRGLCVDDSDRQTLSTAVDAAVDYRGDVKITLRSTGAAITGFVFDRVTADDPASGQVRLLPADGGERVTVPLDDIAALEFTGADAAEGRSFHTWVKKYIEKKRAGEPANIEAMPIEDD